MKLLTLKSKTMAFATIILSLTLPAMSSHAERRDLRELDRRGNQNASIITYELDQIDVRKINETGRLGLKKAINNSGQNLRPNAKILNVEVRGRATGRMSTVSLKVGGVVVDSANLERRSRRGGDRGRSPGNRVNSIILHNNQPRQSEGVWRLVREVDTRIRRVIVTVRTPRRGGGVATRQISLGTKKMTKFIGRSTSFSVHKSNVVSVTMKAHHNDLDISRVVIYYKNGRSQILRDLHGYVRHGRTVTTRVNTRSQVQSISVEAYSPDAIGSTGRLEVLVGVQNRRRN